MKARNDEEAVSDREAILRSILTERPEVITDLQTNVLPLFLTAVNHRFETKLNESRARHEKDCANVPHLCGDLDNYIILQELQPRFDAPIPSRVINPVRDAFPTATALLEADETVALYNSLDEWSKRAGHDGGWFRDHGLAVLRHYIADSDLPWVKLSPGVQGYVTARSWLGAILWDFHLAEYLQQLKLSAN